ncbi:MAG: hypothetical protein F6K31_36905 [Symploca sp. SIO2G7]|nr:hypothetical protein [Symploca sp. SIO2G7]
MQRRLIQKILKLPGMVGFSLIPLNQNTGSVQVYSVGVLPGYKLEQRPKLVQGIQQIIQTTPTFLEFCEFQFGLYQVELHKIEHETLLLVVSQGQLTSQHSKAISELIQFIKADYAALVDSITEFNAEVREQDFELTSAQLQTAKLEDVAAAMNSLSQITSRYLGSQHVANHWDTLQDIAWLDRLCTITNNSISFVNSNPELSPEQLADIRLWTRQFHKECTRFLRDYNLLIEQALPAQHWRLLFGE